MNVARIGNHDAGVISLVVPLLCWTATLVAIVLIDIGAYLTAAAKAQAVADSAALAAINAELDGEEPRPAAGRVASSAGGRLDDCSCDRAPRHVETTVSVAVEGIVLPALLTRRVSASAAATAVGADPDQSNTTVR